MRRAALERRRTLRTWRAHLSRAHGDGRVTCACERQPGRFRKAQRVGGCGNARCHLCHGDKLSKRPTPHQVRSDRSLEEWMFESVQADPEPRVKKWAEHDQRQRLSSDPSPGRSLS